MSVTNRKGERLTAHDLEDHVGGEVFQKQFAVNSEMPKDDEGRLIVEADSDVFPASAELASKSPESAQAVAAFLLSTVCGWSQRLVSSAFGLSGHEAAGYAIKAGERIVREGTVRL